ncbi:uncharacterized protein LOC110377548 [Helicoverpa armigera]|uniref:uncharacterized protein LOC110377548 n=1 Tax=Helicoverpa armigera TaxID=29058 RepID=UPI003083765F
MFVFKAFAFVLFASFVVEAVPVVFKESTPNGESIVAISSSDPNVEKYFTQQFATRSGFKRVDDEEQNRPFNSQGQVPQGTVHSSYSIAVPGKAVAGAGRSFASASSGPFFPLFAFPIIPDNYGFNNFGPNDWVQNVEGFYNPSFPANSQVNSATAINDNGHIYGNVNSVTFDNRKKPSDGFDKPAERSNSRDKNVNSYNKKTRSVDPFDNNVRYGNNY